MTSLYEMNVKCEGIMIITEGFRLNLHMYVNKYFKKFMQQKNCHKFQSPPLKKKGTKRKKMCLGFNYNYCFCCLPT